MSRNVIIESLGASGDGKIKGTDEFVSFVLPDEEVSLDNQGIIGKIIKASSERVVPECEYFGRCGGCKLQHMSESFYKKWKKESLLKTLSQRGISVEVEEPIFVPAHTRRRAEFAFKGCELFGFHGLKSHRILSIKHCLLLSEKLEEALGFLQKFPWKGEGSVLATSCANGLDVYIKSSHRKLDLELHEAFAGLINSTDVKRISWNDELVLEKEPLYVCLGGEMVVFPAGNFLQPSVESEQVLQDLVKKEVSESAKVVDLFCGLGTFTFPLNAAGYDLKVGRGNNFHRRDLFKEPLTAAELTGYNCAVLDPPRAGAAEQVKELARAGNLEKVIYVSCNPATFARDARVLSDSGYVLSRLTPVDQFIYSPYLELVGVFERG